MKQKAFFLILAFLSLTSYHSFAQSAEKIIKKHIKAIGGLKKSQKEVSVHSMGTFEGSMMGNGKIEMFSITNKGFRMNLTKNDTTRSTIMYDHYRWSETTPGKTSKPQKLPDAAWESIDLDLGGEILEYEKKGNTADYMGKESIEGKECYKIKITKKSGKATYYFIDTKTYYILQSTVIAMKDGKGIDGGTSRFGDHRKTAFGLVKPFLLIQVMNGKVVMTTRNTMIEVNKAIDEKVFEMPAN